MKMSNRFFFNERYGILYQTYSRSYFWWEAFAISRRIAFIVASVEMTQQPFFRSQMYSALALFFLFIHVLNFPFQHTSDNRLETWSLFSLCLLAALQTGYDSEGNYPVGMQVLVTLIVFFMLGAFFFTFFGQRVRAMIRQCVRNKYMTKEDEFIQGLHFSPSGGTGRDSVDLSSNDYRQPRQSMDMDNRRDRAASDDQPVTGTEQSRPYSWSILNKPAPTHTQQPLVLERHPSLLNNK